MGRWPASPFGSFADVMHEAPDGVRTLIAPTQEVADFVAETYVFDAVRIATVTTERSPGRLHVDAGGLVADVDVGPRAAVGWLLRAVPGPIARSRAWCTVIDPIARVVLRGVRTRGTAGNGRREWYGATDQHRIAGVTASIAGEDLGALADVWPPVRFGFSSTPRRPSLVRVTTTIRRAPADDALRTAPVSSARRPVP
ncbi:hypothetical protein ACE2AJ_12625 [Aquihabitans daechungensis]|uniref:hypothetical protein n=1 Tax=Aquihabitans daechungensis TaxID=1052257 RepID=UPI003BA05BA8